jgi:hypothetical protein
MTQARGTFDVKVTPVADADADPALGRMTLEKQFRGDLAAASRGQMLTAGNPATGSAGYVAIERVSGTLHGRRGSFALQHSGSMTRGALQLVITVVPGSGTDELSGLTGRMAITIEGGKHSYEFDYALPGPA